MRRARPDTAELHPTAPVAAAPAPATAGRGRWRDRGGSPRGVVGAYLAFGLLWVVFSDRILHAVVEHPPAAAWAQTAKGAAFILVTSALLWVLVHRSEQGIRELTAELRSTLDSMADAVLVVDAGGTIVEVNRAAVELFRAPGRDALLVSVEEFARRYALRTRDGRPITVGTSAVMEALAGLGARGWDGTARGGDGREIWISVAAAPVAEGRTPLAVAVIRDVSASRRLEEMREEFLSTAAHELKTPLAVIKAYAQLMQKRDPDAQALTVIQRQVDRLNRLVHHLLDTSRLSLDATPRRERVDLGRVVADALDALRPSASSHALSLTAVPGATVEADRQRIERVVTSIVDNALRFSPSGGSIEARVERVGDEVICAVTDHGVGIPEEKQARIFERYFRAHAGTPQDYGGLGLSLGVSREIVTRHGGRMWFESAPGRGSTFSFALPAAQAEAP